jgi:hypothetical protein
MTEKEKYNIKENITEMLGTEKAEDAPNKDYRIINKLGGLDVKLGNLPIKSLKTKKKSKNALRSIVPQEED